MLIYKYRNEYVSNLKLKGYENMKLELLKNTLNILEGEQEELLKEIKEAEYIRYFKNFDGFFIGIYNNWNSLTTTNPLTNGTFFAEKENIYELFEIDLMGDGSKFYEGIEVENILEYMENELSNDEYIKKYNALKEFLNNLDPEESFEDNLYTYRLEATSFLKDYEDKMAEENFEEFWEESLEDYYMEKINEKIEEVKNKINKLENK